MLWGLNFMQRRYRPEERVPANKAISDKSVDCDRHPILKKGMPDVWGPASAMKLLEKSQQTITLWSCVYDLKRLTMELCIDSLISS